MLLLVGSALWKKIADKPFMLIFYKKNYKTIWNICIPNTCPSGDGSCGKRGRMLKSPQTTSRILISTEGIM